MNYEMKIKPDKIVLLFFIVLTISSCKKEHWFDCLKSTGKTITVQRPVSYFNQIEMNNNVDLHFHSGATGYVEVTAGANLIDGITTSVENNQLVISNENKCNWVRDFNNTYTVNVWADSLNFLTNNGSGNITFVDTLNTYEFQYDNWNATGTVKIKYNGDRFHANIHTGPADLEVAGITGINWLYYNGYGYMNFKDLKTNITYITNQGQGNCRIRVRDVLEAKIRYIGNIYYAGNPPILVTAITGTGQLIHE